MTFRRLTVADTDAAMTLYQHLVGDLPLAPPRVLQGF